MLKSRIEVELPGVEILRRMGPIEWVASLFGTAPDLRTDRVQLTVSAWSLLDGLHLVLSHHGVHDAVSLMVDKRAVYVDTKEITHDLVLVWEAARLRKVFDRSFGEMHLVLTNHLAGMHLLYDLRVTSKVVEGDPHLTLTISGRPEELRIRRGETAPEYASRVRQLTANDGGLAAYRQAMDVIATEVATAIEREIPGARATVEASQVVLVRPGAREVARFRELRFDDDVEAPAYRPVPSRGRQGAYADTFPHVYRDPYWDFTTFLLLDSMMHHGHWHTPDVVVVDPIGNPLYDGGHVDTADPNWLGDQVSIDAGGVTVDAAIPDSAGWGSDVFGSSTSDGWGGSDVGWGGSDVGSSDTGGSDAGGSSCGSSCSSGSSCGGGCGGGGGD